MMEYFNRTFENVTLSDEEFSAAAFDSCIFIGCTAESVRFDRCRFTDCVFRRCRLSNLRSDYSSLRFAQFEDCLLQGLEWDTWGSGSSFAAPIRSFSDCRIKYCGFTRMNFVKYRFDGCQVLQCTFADCHMSGSSFRGCDLEETEFLRCDLTGADFRDAEGYVIDPVGNKLKNARFSFPDVVRLLSGFGIRIE